MIKKLNKSLRSRHSDKEFAFVFPKRKDGQIKNKWKLNRLWTMNKQQPKTNRTENRTMCVLISIERKLAKKKNLKQKKVVVSTNDGAVIHLSNNRRSVFLFSFFVICIWKSIWRRSEKNTLLNVSLQIEFKLLGNSILNSTNNGISTISGFVFK